MANSRSRSLQSLDAVNFFMADVATGVGPFVAIYLTATKHWNAASVGWVVAAQSLASVAAQAPAGWLVDRSSDKKWIMIIASTLVAAGCIAIVQASGFRPQLLAQIVIGITAAVFGPCIAAISLGIVGRDNLPKRVGRNESFNHSGNVIFALISGALGTFIGQAWIFYSCAGAGVITAAAAARIRNSDIDNGAARGQSGTAKAMPLQQILKHRPIWVFAISVVLFHFANAAMLPLVGELLAKGKPKESAFLMSACIVLAQFVMVPVALATGRLCQLWGRKPLFMIGFGVLMARGFLYTLNSNPYYLLGVQSLDGVGAAIFGVLWVVIISDLTEGSGRFNLMQGLVQAALGLGAFLSNSIAGEIVRRSGFGAGFTTLAVVALAGLLVFGICMPETKLLHEVPTEVAC